MVYDEYKTDDPGLAREEAVRAGNNRSHDIHPCVGWLIPLPYGISICAACEPSATGQMASLADGNIHYALFVCEGRFHMDMDEAMPAPGLSAPAQHSLSCVSRRMVGSGAAELFDAPKRLVFPQGRKSVWNNTILRLKK